MEDNSSVASSGGGKAAGSRSKIQGIPTTTRLQRNQAEKERRDKLNGFISELATLVPMVSNASKPLDKVSILRLAAAEMRLHFSCLNPKKYKGKPLLLPPAIAQSLDLIEKTIGGFIIVTTLTGLIVFCSRSIEEYLGYQNIDVMGNKVMKYIYEDDIKYFEQKVNSVVNSMKKNNKKKTKVIKAHMLQKPLPRSSESCRPRKMIFKISVHQNDMSENGTNGSSNHQSSSTLKKTRPTKDFGYSAVVLMFIEPVQLEPEIDITYIDSNQDVYFTRHGLQGEIIYADQRISSITGYMPHDVQGTSAYQYICGSDVPIALFAQKAMFTSPDGKGVIVYRLKIRDLRYIYLQSSGQIAYKEDSSEISHFVCFNRLLSEDEGSQELKKFQLRYAPQIMAAKMLKVKQNAGAQSPITDLAYDQVMALMNPVAADGTSPVAGINSFQCLKISSPDGFTGIGDLKPSVSASSSSMASSSVHSSEGHSITSPISSDPSISMTSEINGYVSDQQMEIIMESPEQREGGGPLRRTDCPSYTASPYEAVVNMRKEERFAVEQAGNCVSALEQELSINKSSHPENAVTVIGSCRTQKNGQFVSIKSRDKMHSVNAYNSLQNSILVKGSEETLNDHPMNLIFDHSVLQKNTSLSFSASTPNSLNAYAGQSNDLMSVVDGQQSRGCNGQITKENIANKLNNAQLPGAKTAASDVIHDQQLNFNGDQMSRNRLSHIQDTSSFPGAQELSSVSSLSKNSNNQLSMISELGEADYCPDVNSYLENSNYNNSYMSSSVSSYNSGANASVYNSLDVLNSKPFRTKEVNSFHMPVTSVESLNRFNTMDTFDSASVESTPQTNVERGVDFADMNFSGTVDVKPPMTTYLNGSLDADYTIAGRDIVAPLDWTDIRNDCSESVDLPLNGSSDTDYTIAGRDVVVPLDWTDIRNDCSGSVDLSLNKELYRELDLFFQNLPQSNTSVTPSITEAVPEFSVGNSSYSQNSISSSRAKTNYPH